jgi:MarR family transcriptional regulator, temperature-dependent positive regulator of motility
MSKQNSNRMGWTLDQSLVHLLHRAVQAAELVFVECAGEAEVTPRQFAVLAAVAADPNASQTKLVSITGVDRSTLADLVKRLIKKGLLQRKRARSDARAYEVRLTPKAEALIERLNDKAAQADEMLMAPLGQRDRSQLIGTLSALVHAAQRPAAEQHTGKAAGSKKNGRAADGVSRNAA